jgi:hypothetical protein
MEVNVVSVVIRGTKIQETTNLVVTKFNHYKLHL